MIALIQCRLMFVRLRSSVCDARRQNFTPGLNDMFSLRRVRILISTTTELYNQDVRFDRCFLEVSDLCIFKLGSASTKGTFGWNSAIRRHVVRLVAHSDSSNDCPPTCDAVVFDTFVVLLSVCFPRRVTLGTYRCPESSFRDAVVQM